MSVEGEKFDAISSIGMFEHVGSPSGRRISGQSVGSPLSEGRLLNHAISTPGGSKIGSRSFIGRYVFPDGELMDVGQLILDMEKSGFEVRDVESLREHYSKTLHAWVQNLRVGWDEAVSAVGEARARIWLLYMAASANGFDNGGLAVHQVLGLKPSGRGGQWNAAHSARLGLTARPVTTARPLGGCLRCSVLAQPKQPFRRLRLRPLSPEW